MTARKMVVGAIALLSLLMILAIYVAASETVNAASITKQKPKYNTLRCGYFYDTVKLQWKKVKGAKKYIVYRSKSANGKYKKFKATKSLKIAKKASGDYYYKVRAIRGKKKSKFSDAKRIFAANATILGIDEEKSGFLETYYKVLINNKTNTPMIFRYGSSEAAGHKVRIADLKDPNGKPVSTIGARVDVAAGNARLVPAKSKRTLDIFVWTYAAFDLGETGLRDDTYVLMLTTSFKANGQTLALAYTNKAKESGIAGA